MTKRSCRQSRGATLIDYRYILFAKACRLYALASRLTVDCNPCILFKLITHVEYAY